MSATLNKVFIIGNLTRDPELRYIPSGQAVASFTVAVNRKFNDQTGGKKEETTFLRVVAWAKLAEISNQYLQKGSSVFVEGRLQSRSWQAQDGTKRNTIEVIAQSIQFLSRAAGGARASQNNAEPAYTPAGAQNDKEMIIDDSFSTGSMNIAPSELTPDEEVPF